MKSQEELNVLKNEIETLNKKLAELTEDELKQVSGGTTGLDICKDEYERIVLTTSLSSAKDSAAIRTGDSRRQLTAEQLTPEYIHKQIFGKKYDEIFRN